MDGQAWDGVLDKRVVITGATSGIGLAAARQLAALGAQLSIVGRSPERVQQAAASIAAAAPGSPSVDVLVADLASQDAVHHLHQLIKKLLRLGQNPLHRQVAKPAVELLF